MRYAHTQPYLAQHLHVVLLPTLDRSFEGLVVDTLEVTLLGSKISIQEMNTTRVGAVRGVSYITRMVETIKNTYRIEWRSENCILWVKFGAADCNIMNDARWRR